MSSLRDAGYAADHRQDEEPLVEPLNGRDVSKVIVLAVIFIGVIWLAISLAWIS